MEIYLFFKVYMNAERGRLMDRYEALVIKAKMEEALHDHDFRVKIDYKGPKGGDHYRVIVE